MKKTLSAILACCALFMIVSAHKAFAGTYAVTPKAPYITPSLRPIIAKYRQENYVGAMIDLEDLVKKEKNNTYAKYYLALCYTRLGFKDEAKTLYTEVSLKDDNLTLTHYSKKALVCLEAPENSICSNEKKAPEKNAKDEEQLDDITKFIQSGKKIHPAAMDRITKERMERKLEEEEYIRNQQQGVQPQEEPSAKPAKKAHPQQAPAQKEQAQPAQKTSSVPTNEEIASALNTLSKIGMNPYVPQPYNLLGMNLTPDLQEQFGYLNYQNNDYFNAILRGTANSDSAKMYLYNQLTQQNNLLNYGL